MTRGQLSDAGEAQRERIEGALASLGIALVYAELARVRVSVTVKRMGMAEVLEPGIADLEKVEKLIKQAQKLVNDIG